uniref:Uncharacterized protein n=1 Tax=Oryza glumipatula TaxID=40148 RepID=A0A0E0BFR3_9ORYZ
MAAATGYGDAPTADDLVAYDQLLGLRHTRHMAEVFAVRLPDSAGRRPAAPSASAAATTATTSSTAAAVRTTPPTHRPATPMGWGHLNRCLRELLA